MPIRTLDLTPLATQVGNIYEAVVIISKRARQVSSNIKAELDEELTYFEGLEADFDDQQTSDEQARVSMKYEIIPKPSETSIKEMLAHEIYYRNPNDPIEGDEGPSVL